MQATFVYVPAHGDDLSDAAIELDIRTQQLQLIAAEMGYSLVAIKADQLKKDTELIADYFRGSHVVWWAGRMVFFKEAKQIWELIQSHLRNLSLDIPVLDTPINVENVFDLSQSYPILEQAGVIQAKTQFIPLPSEKLSQTKEEIYNYLEESLEEKLGILLEDRKIEEHGIFFRTYYGTQKLDPRLNIGLSRKNLVEGCSRLIQILQKHQQNIGGIALREVVPIKCIEDSLTNNMFRCEFRVFISHQEPLMWFCNNKLAQSKKMSPQGLKELSQLTITQLNEMNVMSRQIGNSLKTTLIVADFAVLIDGRVILLETNPGCCAGWPHPFSYVGVYGQYLRQILKLTRMESERLKKVATKFNIEQWGEGTVFGFFN